jgi:hypothetical protein
MLFRRVDDDQEYALFAALPLRRFRGGVHVVAVIVLGHGSSLSKNHTRQQPRRQGDDDGEDAVQRG